MKSAIKEKDAAKKGNMFEEFFENLVAGEQEFTLIKRHARSDVGEMDYFYKAKCSGHPLWEKCPYLFIECKNWKEVIKSEKMSHFTSLLESKSVFGNCCGVYISTSSFSPQAVNASKKGIEKKGLVIFRINRKDLSSLIEKGFRKYLEDEFDTLLSKI